MFMYYILRIKYKVLIYTNFSKKQLSSMNLKSRYKINQISFLEKFDNIRNKLRIFCFFLTK